MADIDRDASRAVIVYRNGAVRGAGSRRRARAEGPTTCDALTSNSEVKASQIGARPFGGLLAARGRPLRALAWARARSRDLGPRRGPARGPQPTAARRRHGRPRPAADPRRRRLGQDPRPDAPDRLPAAHRPG